MRKAERFTFAVEK